MSAEGGEHAQRLGCGMPEPVARTDTDHGVLRADDTQILGRDGSPAGVMTYLQDVDVGDETGGGEGGQHVRFGVPSEERLEAAEPCEYHETALVRVLEVRSVWWPEDFESPAPGAHDLALAEAPRLGRGLTSFSFTLPVRRGIRVEGRSLPQRLVWDRTSERIEPARVVVVRMGQQHRIEPANAAAREC